MIHLLLAALAAISVTVMFFASCVNSTTKDVVYPPTWPIPELVVPDGSTLEPIPELFADDGERRYIEAQKFTTGTTAEHTYWSVHFKSKLSTQEAYSHFDKILVPLGFDFEDNGLGPRHYLHSDNTLYVFVEHLTADRVPGIDHEYFVINVQKYIYPQMRLRERIESQHK